ncbi:M13 family metallopeptidase [bacterium]|nr:M13 family metallopeptidase [bacterium]
MKKVRIQDDLYTYVNQEWLESAVIPDDKPTTGGFAVLADGVEKLMMDEFKNLTKENNYPSEHMKYACKLYSKVLNTKKRNKDGIKPALKTLQKIQKLNTVSDLNKKIKELVIENLPLPFTFSIDVDMKDADKHAIFIQGPSVILPDTTFYKEGMEERKAMLLGFYKNMLEGLLSFAELSKEEIDTYIADTFAFDELIAKYVKSNEEWSEYAKMYNPYKLSKVNSLLKPIKFKKLVASLYETVPEKIIVTEPRYFLNFKEVFNEETFTLYKHWAYTKQLVKDSAYLSEELREIGTSYRRAISGIKVMPSVEKYAYQVASNFYTQPVGLYYALKYFGEEAKKDVTEMVSEIIEAYKERVKNSDILADSTKEKAILKLSTMKVKMGYPDKIDSIFDKFVFEDKDSLYKAVSTIRKEYRLDELSNLTKEVDRGKWYMPGHLVNASYNPSSNDITFPAAILQAPFYSIKQTRSQNLGGIGAVIGHEISHAFDNNGALFDEKGNLNNWWTKEDFKKFNSRTKAMIKQFDGIELPWGKVNGSFIVSENIADNGGVAVTLHVMKKMDNPNYSEYFTNWAKVWCLKAKEEYLKLLLAMDVHGPAILRANMPPKNFEEWYDTFNVTKKDKMYIAPSKRVVIW